MNKEPNTMRVMLRRPILQPSENGPRHAEPTEILELDRSDAIRLCNTASPKAMPYETDEEQDAANEFAESHKRALAARLEKEEVSQDGGVGESDEAFECPYCEKVYKSQKTLDKHIQAKHPEDWEANHA